MIHIETRKTPSGKWWCNATINGYDYSFEDTSILGSQLKMMDQLNKLNISPELCVWEPFKIK